MGLSRFSRAKVRLWAALSTLIGAFAVFVSVASAHEVMPAIADLEQVGSTLRFSVAATVESYIAGVDLEGLEDTNAAGNAEDVDALRALSSEELAERFRDFWPQMAEKITVQSGGQQLPLTLTGIEVFGAPDIEIARQSVFRFDAALPEGASEVIVGWTADLGALVLRQQGVEDPYDGYLDGGALSPPIALGSSAGTGPPAFAAQIPVGLSQIVPYGPEHALVMLAMFFLSAQTARLAWQFGAFALGLLALPVAAFAGVVPLASLWGPLVALSVIVLALDTLFSRGSLRPWRLPLLVGFGVVHGLALSADASPLAALGISLGVLLGLASVIAAAFLITFAAMRSSRGERANTLAGTLCLGLALILAGLAVVLYGGPHAAFLPFLAMAAILLALSGAANLSPAQGSYERIVAQPASVLIALMGAWWLVERLIL